MSTGVADQAMPPKEDQPATTPPHPATAAESTDAGTKDVTAAGTSPKAAAAGGEKEAAPAAGAGTKAAPKRKKKKAPLTGSRKKKQKTGAKTAATKGKGKGKKGEEAAVAGDEGEEEGGEEEESTTSSTTPTAPAAAAATESTATVKPVVAGEAESSPQSKAIAEPTATIDPLAKGGKEVETKSIGGGPSEPAAAAAGVPPVKGSDAPVPTDSIQGAAHTGAHLDALKQTAPTDTDVAMKPVETQKQGNLVAGGGAESNATVDNREQKAASPVLPTVS